MQHILGAKTNSEQAYAFARLLKDHDDRDLFYWLLPEDREAHVSAELLRLFIHLLGIHRQVVVLDPTSEEAMLSYGRLHHLEPAVYVLSKNEFGRIPLVR